MTTCATASRMAGEPLAATAATARTWLLIEQPGPWGAKALTASHLAPELGRALDRAASPHGVRVALVRRPGPHPDHGGTAPRRVFLAHTLPGRSWVLTGTAAPGPEGPGDLLALDFAALGAGDPAGAGPEWRSHQGPPLALVCTNGKRDRCCAVHGRPLAAELAAAGHADVWEITHIGGHRFAPTLLVLPYGYAYGRAAAHSAKSVLEAVRDGRVTTDGCRGRSAWERPGQAADLAVRELTGEQGADALHVVATEAASDATADRDCWTVTVAHADGRRWRVRVAALEDEPPQAPASCGAALGLPARMHVESVQPAGETGGTETGGTETGGTETRGTDTGGTETGSR